MGEISLKQLVASPIQAAVAASQRLRPAHQDDPGWKACMRILPDTRQERGQKRRASHKGLQLFRILECSQLMHAMEANVAWYTGGREAVTLPEEDDCFSSTSKAKSGSAKHTCLAFVATALQHIVRAV